MSGHHTVYPLARGSPNAAAPSAEDDSDSTSSLSSTMDHTVPVDDVSSTWTAQHNKRQSTTMLPVWAIHANDTPLDTTRKGALLVLLGLAFAYGCVGALAVIMPRMVRHEAGAVYDTVWIAVATVPFLALLMVLCVRRVAHAALSWCAVGAAMLAVMMWDLRAAATAAPRVWPLLFCVITAAAGTRRGAHGVAVCAALAALWVILLASEQAFNAGAFDSDVLTAAFGPLAARAERLCGCTHPPCPTGGWEEVPVAVGMAAALLVHAALALPASTAPPVAKVPSKAASRHEDPIANMVSVTRTIANLLVEFDLHAARHELRRSQAHVPPDMYQSLALILDNIEAYQHFLPDGLMGGLETLSRDILNSSSRESRRGSHLMTEATELTEGSCNDFSDFTRFDPHAAEAAGHPAGASAVLDLPQLLGVRRDNLISIPAERDAPGTGPASEGHAALVFTDIRSSTAIWNSCPAGMKIALRIHNRIIRERIITHQGYEVKTIGDAFMVAFDTAVEAVRFGSDVHEALLDTEWPETLLTLRECRRDPHGLWGGLTVRIGVGYGPVETEQNELTGRWDYFGETVNGAARLEAACPPGTITGVADVMNDVMAQLADEVALVGTFRKVLKGFEAASPKDGVEVTALVPAGLADRKLHPYERWVEAQDAARSGRGDAASVGDVGGGGGGSGGGLRRKKFSKSIAIAMALMKENVGVLRCFKSASVATLEVTTPALPKSPLLCLPSADPSAGAYAPAATAMSPFLERVSLAASRTTGTIVTTIHTLVVVAWGVVEETATNRIESLRFISMLRDDAAGHVAPSPPQNTTSSTATGSHGMNNSGHGAPPPIAWVGGVSASAVYAGTIGTGTQRYISVIGPAAGLSMALVTGARERGVDVLFGCYEAMHSYARTNLMHLSLAVFDEGFSAPGGVEVCAYTLGRPASCRSGGSQHDGESGCDLASRAASIAGLCRADSFLSRLRANSAGESGCLPVEEGPKSPSTTPLSTSTGTGIVRAPKHPRTGSRIRTPTIVSQHLKPIPPPCTFSQNTAHNTSGSNLGGAANASGGASGSPSGLPPLVQLASAGSCGAASATSSPHTPDTAAQAPAVVAVDEAAPRTASQEGGRPPRKPIDKSDALGD